MADYDGRHATERAGTQQLWAGVIVFVVSVAALLYMETRGLETTTFMILVGPVVAAFFVSGRVEQLTAKQNRQLAQQDRKLEQITELTNGTLDRRIRDQVVTALRVSGVAPTNDRNHR